MKEKKQMRRLLGCLLLMVCLLGCFKVSVYAAENERVINVTGIKTVKIYTADKKQEIEVKKTALRQSLESTVMSMWVVVQQMEQVDILQ